MTGRQASKQEVRTKPRRSWGSQQSVFVFRLAHVLTGLLIRYWIRCFRVLGAGHLPAQGGVFVVANHTTAMDPFLVGYAIPGRMPAGPGKIELFANPVVAFLMRKLGIFPLRQGMADAVAVRTMVGLYREGRVVIVFPEGTRSPTGELGSFMPDFARLVIKLRAPMVPAGIAGGKQLLPIGSLIPRRNTPVVVSFGNRFELDRFYGAPTTPSLVEEATDLLVQRITEQLAVARAERERLAAHCP